MTNGKSCYWRFKGKVGEFRYGWPTWVKGNLWLMGLYNGDYTHGPIVDEYEIECRP